MPKIEKAEKQYELTAKESKTMLDKENKSRAAAVYQAISKKGPATLEQLFEACEKAFQPFRGKKENLKGNIRTFVREFIDSGHVKITKAEAVEAKPKAARKPRAKKVTLEQEERADSAVA